MHCDFVLRALLQRLSLQSHRLRCRGAEENPMVDDPRDEVWFVANRTRNAAGVPKS